MRLGFSPWGVCGSSYLRWSKFVHIILMGVDAVRKSLRFWNHLVAFSTFFVCSYVRELEEIQYCVFFLFAQRVRLRKF